MKKQLRLATLLLFLALEQLGSCGTIAYYDMSLANNSALVTQMKSDCQSTSSTMLGLCNSTCSTCVPNNQAECLTCSEGFILVGTKCLIDTSMYTYFYSQYLGPVLTDTKKTLGQIRFSQSNESLTSNYIISICSYQSFVFYTAGWFKATDNPNLQIYKVDKIDQIQIKMNFASVVQNITFTITVNDNIIFNQNYGSLTNQSGDYFFNKNTSQTSYMRLPTLTNSKEAKSIWQQVNTGLISYVSNQMTIKFSITGGGTQTYIWGFNDIVLLTRDCQTCVKEDVRKLLVSLGSATAFTLLAVIFLIIILCFAIQLQIYQQKKEFQEKMGMSSSSGNLPIKAMNRVSDTIKRMVKAKEKEMGKDEISYKKALQEKDKFLQNQPNSKGKIFQKLDSMGPG